MYTVIAVPSPPELSHFLYPFTPFIFPMVDVSLWPDENRTSLASNRPDSCSEKQMGKPQEKLLQGPAGQLSDKQAPEFETCEYARGNGLLSCLEEKEEIIGIAFPRKLYCRSKGAGWSSAIP